jgi:hypothetical protein
MTLVVPAPLGAPVAAHDQGNQGDDFPHGVGGEVVTGQQHRTDALGRFAKGRRGTPRDRPPPW